MSLFKSKKLEMIDYDKAEKHPAVKSSICTGEMVAGFIDINTQKFHDYMLIRNDAELELFCMSCGIDTSELKRIV